MAPRHEGRRASLLPGSAAKAWAPMTRYILSRLLTAIPVLFGVLLFGFALLKLVPGDPAAVVGGPMATPEVIEAIRREMGLDRPVAVQFLIYLGRVLRGDLGYSLISNTRVTDELAEAIGPTVELMVACLVWSIPLGIALGMLAATFRGRIVDRLVIAVSVLGVSMPIFFVSLLLVQYVGYRWNLLPFLGRGGPVWTAEGLSHLVMPALALGFFGFAVGTPGGHRSTSSVSPLTYSGCRGWPVCVLPRHLPPRPRTSSATIRR